MRIISNIMGKSTPSSPGLIQPKCCPNLYKKIVAHRTVKMVNSTAKIIFIRNIFHHLPYVSYGSKMKYLLAGYVLVKMDIFVLICKSVGLVVGSINILDKIHTYRKKKRTIKG